MCCNLSRLNINVRVKLCLYILASFKREEEKSTEAGLKYFVLSALSSGLLLYGCSLIYGFTGSTNFEVIFSLLCADNTQLKKSGTL